MIIIILCLLWISSLVLINKTIIWYFWDAINSNVVIFFLDGWFYWRLFGTKHIQIIISSEQIPFSHSLKVLKKVWNLSLNFVLSQFNFTVLWYIFYFLKYYFYLLTTFNWLLNLLTYFCLWILFFLLYNWI